MSWLSTGSRRSLAALCCAVVLSQVATAGAQSSDDDARRHYEAGASYFNTSDYEGALREFNMAYKLSDAAKRPAILRNVAAVYERMGDLPKTVETLEQLLRDDPETPERKTIELRIENLKVRIAAQPDAGAAVVAPPPPVASTTATGTKPPPPPPAAGEPNYTPAYVSWGIGGAALLGAAVTGYLAKSSYDDKDEGCGQTPEGCSDSDVKSVETMAWVSTALTGVAVVGVGVGTILYFTAEPPTREQATGWTPQLAGGVSPSGGGFDARWTF
jgi:tetratricopeptide (TPR) repeat protein